MFNRKRTLEVFGYDIDPSVRRRTKAEFEKTDKSNKRCLIVVDNCPLCNKERHIKLSASRKNRPCSHCHHSRPEVREAKIKAHTGRVFSEETRQKMRNNHWARRGVAPSNKGQVMDDEFKNKVSASIKQWNDSFPEEVKKMCGHKAAATKAGVEPDQYVRITEANVRARGLPEYKEWEEKVFKRDGFHCKILGCEHSRPNNITAHHLDGFHWCVDKRHVVANGITLCKYHHRQFHSEYGNSNNTEAQFKEWVQKILDPNFVKPTIFMVIGCSGSGKSWVCNQLKDLFTYISYDSTRKKNHISGLLAYSDKPKLYDPPIKISTFFKRNSSRFNIRCVAILESDDVVKSRIEKRGGEWTDHISKRNKTMRKRAEKYAEFSGTSEQVLDYLKNIQH